MRAPERSRAGRHRRGGTPLNVIIALVGIVFAGLVAYGIFWTIKSFGQAGEQYSQTMIKASNDATALRCQINMRSIWQCLQSYIAENDELPSSRDALVRAVGDARAFCCDEPNGLPYVYIAGQGPNMPESNVLVYEPRPVHQGRSIVLHLGGRIDALDEEALKRAVQATQAQITGRQ